jgi:hypothetical protein
MVASLDRVFDGELHLRVGFAARSPWRYARLRAWICASAISETASSSWSASSNRLRATS